MAEQSSGLKTKLTLSPCTLQKNGDLVVGTGKLFEVMLNPASYSHEYSIRYNKQKALGQSAVNTKYSDTNAEKVTFDIVIDGTGVLPPSTPGKASPDVRTQIQQLSDIVYKYHGPEHEPNYVRVLWGSLLFFGRLESMSIDYTLFTPSGTPLRARVKLAFTGFMSKEEEALRANRSSPDLTHIVEVKAGDTLPLLCYRIYRDCRYYMQVAKENHLVNFRALKPGMRLHFPPLR